MSFFENTRRPEGFGGRVMVCMMNLGHRALARWGLSYLKLPEDAEILDCGCGGGANIKALLKKCPAGTVRGIDYADISVEKARRVNQKAIADGRCEILRASAAALPFEPAQFDLVTAFETVYFWPDLPQCFGEVFRVLKPGGTFFICNECSGDTAKDDKWTKAIRGMRIYKDTELAAVLEQTGFWNVKIQKNNTGWLCLAAQKPAQEDIAQ